MITVSGSNFPWREGMTVADLLKEIDDSQPCAVVRINDTYVSQMNFENTVIPDDSEVFLIPMIAGG
ncbi:MAG: sulfur carrier protein ThiS [Desulfobacterales bacterium]|jgi:sulfur carrier protein ThiS|nr:MAG: sulfur carrier protein ThiS [Desulfobacterales bacterium]